MRTDLRKMFGCGTGFFSGNRLLPRPTFTTIAPSQLASWPPAGPSKFLSLRRTAARAPILPAAAGRADSRTMVPANGPAVRCLEKPHLERDHRAAEHGGMHQVPHLHGRAGHRDDRNGADDGGGAWQAPPWATSRARTAIMRSTVITVDLRRPDLMLDDDDDRLRGRARRDGIHLYATDMQHSAGKRAAARVRSCRRRPCPRRGWPPRINPRLAHGTLASCGKGGLPDPIDRGGGVLLAVTSRPSVGAVGGLG